MIKNKKASITVIIALVIAVALVVLMMVVPDGEIPEINDFPPQMKSNFQEE